MTRMTRWTFDTDRDTAEPARDSRLGALLREVVGDPPVDEVDWRRLAGRIGAALEAQPAAWWSYAESWQRRVLPLALAAGLIGALTIWATAGSARADAAPVIGTSDLVSDVVWGTPSAEVARSYARSLVNSDELSAGVRE